MLKGRPLFLTVLRYQPLPKLSINTTSKMVSSAANVKPEMPNVHTSVGADGQVLYDLTFVSEPLGLPAQDGYGWPQIEFGQVVGPEGRYTICRKLGWGMSSSTWLARDAVKNSYVAIKVLSGNCTDLVQRGLVWEHEALRHVSSPASNPYCLQLLSDFQLPGKGSAGQHLCFVTQVFGGDVKSLFAAHSKDNNVFPLPLAKRILLHTLRGIAHAHSCGVVHTDLKHDNIFFDSRMLTGDFEHLLASDPSRRHPPEASQDGTVQAAVSQPLPIPTIEEAMQRTFVLGDFGSAQPIKRHIVNTITAVQLRPPEIIIGGPWNETVDIWSFGCFVFEVVTGRSFFKYQPNSKFNLDESSNMLYQMLCYTGEDFEWLDVDLQCWKSTGNLKENPTLWNYPFEMSLRSHKVLEEADVLPTAALMRRCLRLDPTERASAVDLLSDPWFDGVD